MAVKVTKYTLGSLLDEAADRYGDKDALVYDKQRVTYRQFGQKANDLAKCFIKFGAKKNDKIGIWMTDNEEWLPTYFALASIGAVAVPINARYRAEDAKYVINHSDMVALVVSDRAPEIVDYVGMLNSISSSIAKTKGYELTLPELPQLKHIITVGGKPHPGMIPFEDTRKVGAGISDGELEKRKAEVTPDDLAMFQYTSGTTAFPKGCMIMHRNLIRNSLICGRREEFHEGEDRFYDPMPPFHIAGLTYGIIPCIIWGGCRFGSDHYDPLEALKIIDREKCTITNGFDVMIMGFLDHPDFSKYNVTSLRTGFFAAPPHFQRIVRTRMPHYIPVNAYGLSEVGGNLTTSLRSNDLETLINYHGIPQDDMVIRIVDRETGKEVPPGQDGEITCKGWSVMKGYYKNDAETANTIRDGFLSTGDLGFVNPETGQLLWKGRFKDLFKVGGENVSPPEVEGFLMKNPKVKLAQVVGVPDKRMGEVVAAFVELRPGESANEEEIINYCRGKIASFKIPKYVKIVKEWPKSAVKVQRRDLLEIMKKELGIT